MAEIHLRECSSITSSPRRKPPPSSARIPVPFEYTASNDGTDENLLILLHGLGDTHIPFAKLGRSFNLPQTATLALRAPEQIPFLYEQAYQWYTSFDPLGDLIERPNPTPALDLLCIVIAHLVDDCNWLPLRIHLFGFAQGGSVAVESVISWWKCELSRTRKLPEDDDRGGSVTRPIGSVVTVGGPLLSYPTLEKPCPTRLLVFHRGSLCKSASTSFSKAFARVQEVERRNSGQDERMPCSKDEWEPIMRFWSEVLGRRTGEDLYEVMSGAT
ncbi:hypothetical protein EV401DRAFT_2053664 [Pisolithus croceorrhizus]|nr:hypothetical protein EV401DRAFT_2053664 [Pisolithus croceorrhizus]